MPPSAHEQITNLRRRGGRAANCSCHMKNEDRPPGSLHPIRAYDPAWHDFFEGQISDIIVACRCCNENRIRMEPCYACPRPSVRVRPVDYDGNTVVVAIDGACRENGLANARGSIGVFYGPGAECNRSSLLPATYQQTNQVAELYAAISVLREATTKAKPWKSDGSHTCKILIMTDSAYVVNGISDHIWKWKTNGFRTAQNRPIANLMMWLELDEMMLEFEANDVDVWFWYVRREFNRDADRLANEAFDGIGRGVRLEMEFMPWE